MCADAESGLAQRLDVAAIGDLHRAACRAGAALPAKRHRHRIAARDQIRTRFGDGGRGRPGQTAASPDRLRRDAVGRRAGSGDEPGVAHSDTAGGRPAAAFSAQRHADIRIGPAGLGRGAARLAPAATDALREYPARESARGGEGAIVDHLHRAAGRPAAALLADIHRHRIGPGKHARTDAGVPADPDRTGSAAAAADALCDDRIRHHARRADGALLKHLYRAADTACAAKAADLQRQSARCAAKLVLVVVDIAAAAADRLRTQARGPIAGGDDHALLRHLDRARSAPIAGATADQHIEAGNIGSLAREAVNRGIAAAACDRLGDQPGAVDAARQDHTVMGDGNRPCIAAACTAAANRHRKREGVIAFGSITLGEDEIVAAIAAAAADALREQAIGIVAMDGDQTVASRGEAVPQRHCRTIARRAPCTADTDRDRIGRRSDDAGKVEPARAAAAADRLGNDTCAAILVVGGHQHAVGIRHRVDEDGAVSGEVDRACIGACAPKAADTDGRGNAVFILAAGDHGGDVEPPDTAAAANALRNDTARGFAGDHHQPAMCARHLARAVARAARTAEAEADGRLGIAGGRDDRSGKIEATRTAAAANALRQQAGCIEPFGAQIDRAADPYIPAGAAAAAKTADADTQRAVGRQAAGEIEPAAAAAAADRLRQNGIFVVAIADDHIGNARPARERERDIGRIAARSAEAPDPDRGDLAGPALRARELRRAVFRNFRKPLDAFGIAAAAAGDSACRVRRRRAGITGNRRSNAAAGCRHTKGQLRGDIEGAVPAAAADALRDDTRRVIARHDAAGNAGCDRAAGPAIAPETADADPGCNVGSLEPVGKPAVDIETAIAAAAADRLDQHAGRIAAERFDQTVELGRDSRGIAAAAAKPAKPETERGRTLGGQRDRAGHVESAVAPAAADRLDHRAKALLAAGDDFTLLHQFGRCGIAAAAAKPADPQADRSGLTAGRKRNAARYVEPAIAAAAAGAGNENAVRSAPAGQDIALHTGIHGSPVATFAAETAHADANARGRAEGRQSDPAADVERTIAAAAASALGHECGGPVAAGLDRTGTGGHCAAIAAKPAHAADSDADGKADPGFALARNANVGGNSAADIETAIPAAAAGALREQAARTIT